MSKLDIIILDCANKVLDGKEETLGDYIDPTKQAVKALMLELAYELTDDLSGLGRDIIDADELKLRISDL